MADWWALFLALDIVLAGALYYVIAFRRGSRARLAWTAGVKTPVAKETESDLMKSLKSELDSVNRSVAALDRKKAKFEEYEKELRDRLVKLDDTLKRAESDVNELEAKRQAGADGDRYRKAGKMLKMGLPVEEVVKDLGILKGEAELISAINEYRQ